MLNKENLIKYFEDGITEKGDVRIGTEHEKFVFNKNDCSLIPYKGEQSISALLEAFIQDDWKPKYEGDNIIALSKENASITLEPGGQFELSGAPLVTIHETCREINNHLKFVKSIEEKMNIGFLGVGFLPIEKLDDVPHVPKKRYSEIMRPYMKKLGGLGLDMMHRSCTVQANFDYISELDMKKKIMVSAALQPIVTGLFANSPFLEGQLNGFQSYRGYVWTKTDDHRTGILRSMVGENFSFEEYVDYALKVPVYSIIRNGNYINCLDYNFEDLMNNKFHEVKSEEITLDDWTDHLSTIFTEVRLKTYIEMRGADAGSYRSLCALPAFWAGILYCSDCLEESISIVREWSFEEIVSFRNSVFKNGLNAKLKDRNGWEIAEQFLKISSKGLESRSNLNAVGENETIHIDYLFEMVQKKETSALRLINLYKSKWNNDLKQIYSSESF
jgi:glutamate--cysteine ligase